MHADLIIELLGWKLKHAQDNQSGQFHRFRYMLLSVSAWQSLC